MKNRFLLVVGVALLLCALPNTNAGAVFTASFQVSQDIFSDQLGGVRSIQLTILSSLQTSNSAPSIQSITSPVLDPYTFVITPDAGYNSAQCSSSDNPCLQRWGITITSSSCVELNEALLFSYVATDSSMATSPGTFSVSLLNHDFCASSLFTLSADITSFGAYSDSLFSQTKATYYVSDMVYFPFQVNYKDMIISSVSFDTISVEGGNGVGSVPLFSGGINTGAGDATALATFPITSTLKSGSATAWFALELNRSPRSPFANTPTGSTTYTFFVTFDVQYQNAKRSLETQPKHLYSKASIVLANRPSVAGEKVI